MDDNIYIEQLNPQFQQQQQQQEQQQKGNVDTPTARDDDDDDEENNSNNTALMSRMMDQNDYHNIAATSNAVAVPTTTTTTATTNTNNIMNQHYYFEMFLFFSCGVGTSLCYIATLSGLVYFMIHYGKNMFVYLNLAVYFPLLPISILQVVYDTKYDLLYKSSYITYFFRGIIGFILSIFGTIGVALTGNSDNKTFLLLLPSPTSQLLVAAVLQGIGGAILLGTLNQMASFVIETDKLLLSAPGGGVIPPYNTATTAGAGAGDADQNSSNSESGGGRRLKASLSAGVQASALIVLFISIIIS